MHVPLASNSPWWARCEELEEAFYEALKEVGADGVAESEEEGSELCVYMSGFEQEVLAQVARSVLRDAGLLAGAYAELSGPDLNPGPRIEL